MCRFARIYLELRNMCGLVELVNNMSISDKNLYLKDLKTCKLIKSSLGTDLHKNNLADLLIMTDIL